MGVTLRGGRGLLPSPAAHHSKAHGARPHLHHLCPSSALDLPRVPEGSERLASHISPLFILGPECSTHHTDAATYVVLCAVFTSALDSAN